MVRPGARPAAWLALAAIPAVAAAAALPDRTPLAPVAPLTPIARRSATPLERPWIEVTPLAWASEPRVFDGALPGAAIPLAGVPEGMAMVCLGAEGRAARCERALLAKGRTVELADPQPGLAVAGRVLLGRLPAPGLRISVAPAGLASRRAWTVPLGRSKSGAGLLREVRSGADGRFSIPPLAPGRYVLEASSAGLRSSASEPFAVPDPAALRRRNAAPAGQEALALADWSLAEGVELPVRVTDAGGAPIAGAEVAALTDAEGVAESVPAARTGPDGRATLARLDPAAGIQVHCAAEGYVAADEAFARLPPEARCALVRQASLAGRVVATDDRPVAGAVLTLGRGRPPAVSDAAGAFSFASLAPGRYRLVAAAPGWRAAAATVQIAAGERRSLGALRLSPAARLFGKVADATSGDPVAGARVAVAEAAGGAAATTAGDGTFSLTAGTDFALELEIRAPGFPVERVAVAPELHTSEEAPLLVQLSPGGRVQAVAWDEEADAPCLGCTVQLLGAAGEPATLTTDASGEAVSDLLAPGPWDAYLETAESVGSTVRVHSDAARSVTVAAGATARVEFGRRATLRLRFGSPLPAGWMVAASGASLRAVVSADADGTFAIRRPAGEEVALALVDASFHRIEQAVVPAAYEDPALVLSLPATSVRGVLALGDRPGSDLQVTLVGGAGGGDRASALADGQGAFEIPFVPPGAYSLAVEGRPVRSLGLRDGESLDLGAVRLPDANRSTGSP